MAHSFLTLVSFMATSALVEAQAFPPPLSDTQVVLVREAIDSMKRDPRGPYFRIRWFCNDGAVLAPEPYACVPHGGGAMYGELNDRAKQLAGLHFHIGTVLQATPKDSLFDEVFANHWLKELVVQQYLVEVDDGWALRQARYYRGAKQIEDEEQRGRELLEWLLAKPQWSADNYFLLMRLAAVLPHPGPGGDRISERVRNLATEAADLDRRLQPLRVKIHSFPSRDDLDSVQVRLGRPGLDPNVKSKLEELRDALRVQYDPRHAVETLSLYRRRLQSAVGPEIASIEQSLTAGRSREMLDRIAALAPRVRRMVLEGTDGGRKLALLDLQRSLLELAFVVAQELEAEQRQHQPREARLAYVDQLAALAYAAGFLSARERAAVVSEGARLRSARSVTALEYKNTVAYMARSLDWSTGTVRGVFSPVVERYAAVDSKAWGFIDAQLRGSVLLPLSQELGRLATDADRVIGASHDILGQRLSQGVRAVNPGVALRPLEIVPPDALEVHFDQNKIYVIPATTPELRPVAGVVTLDEGNLLSHVQLLARNLGIPNAAVLPTNLGLLQRAAGRETFFVVTPLGRVVLKLPDQLTAIERSLIEEGRQAQTERVTLDTDRLQLDRVVPIRLSELRATASGVLVGPKAANLGQLAFYFPDKVSAGVALPFGMFYQHVNRLFAGSSRTVLEELDDAYGEAVRMRRRGAPEAEIDALMFRALARVRQAIVELPWLPEMQRLIERAIRDTFGDNLAEGVFVRSDTNVEDLPQFSGAGLNLTVAHQTTFESVLTSIRRVWTSPFSERAYLWRKQILEEQSRIYPSVLLLASVPSEKSGVLITSGLDEGGPDDLTIAAAEGVGGAVEGEEAETIVVHRDGSIRLLSQAKAPARRRLQDGTAGGVMMVPSARSEYLLSNEDIAQLRDVVRTWKSRFAPDGVSVWDIEYGFVGDKLWLFQIRPFVQFRSSALLERMRVLDREVQGNANRIVSLEEAV